MESELEIVRRRMGTEPVNVAAIFAELGVDYEERPILSGESGWIECRDGQFKVVINSSEGEQRKRFTAAHELAHYLLHRDILCEGGRMNRHTDRLFGNDAAFNRESPFKRVHEVQANKLAAQIIMPSTRIQDIWNELGVVSPDAKVGSLATQFGVSRAAMEIRARTLGLIN